VLADRPLIDSYLADRDAVLLHDVFRTYLRHLIGLNWHGLHLSLVESYRRLAGDSWAGLGLEHSYMWRQLPHHLHEAELADELGELLASRTTSSRRRPTSGTSRSPSIGSRSARSAGRIPRSGRPPEC
jgi:hypothetical protein